MRLGMLILLAGATAIGFSAELGMTLMALGFIPIWVHAYRRWKRSEQTNEYRAGA